MKEKEGYLLIELAIVFALVAFLAGMGVSLGSTFKKMQVRAQAEKISAYCMSVRYRAMGSQKKIVVGVDLKNGSLTPDDDGYTLKLPNGIKFGYQKNALGPPSSPSKPLQSASSFKDNEISFYPDGSVTSGALYIVDQKRQIMYACTLSLPDTFYVRLYVYTYGKPKRI